MYWFLGFLFFYASTGIVILGIRNYVRRVQGVTKEYTEWWHNYCRYYEGNPYYDMGCSYKYCGRAPYPRPEKFPSSLKFYYNKVFIMLAWPITVLITLIVLVVTTIIRMLSNTYEVYPEKIADFIEKGVNKYGNRLE